MTDIITKDEMGRKTRLQSVDTLFRAVDADGSGQLDKVRASLPAS